MPSIVVIADDLSGALDASACFVRRGHKVQVALTPDALPEAVNTGAEFISVSTGSRESDEDTARADPQGLEAYPIRTADHLKGRLST